MMLLTSRHLPIVVLTGMAAVGTVSCDRPTQGAAPAASASPSATPMPLLRTFAGLGLTFQYPDPYQVEKATSNPVMYQVALDHHKEPGVLTVRFNPQNPGGAVSLDDVAQATRLQMGGDAQVEPAKLIVAGKEYEARAVKANSLGMITTTDVTAVVQLGATNYVVLTHTSDDDRNSSQKMFDVVLRTLAPSPPE